MSDTPETKQIKLDESLSLSALTTLYDLLKENRGSPVCLDASEVQTINGLCLQLLVSAEKTWRADDLAFDVEPQSEAFQAALASTGIPVFINHAQEA